MTDEYDNLTDATPSKEIFVRIGVSLNQNPDVASMGPKLLGQWILLLTYIKKWGDRGHLKYRKLSDFVYVMLADRRTYRQHFRTLIAHGWLYIDETKKEIIIPKWRKYQENPIPVSRQKSGKNPADFRQRDIETEETIDKKPPLPPLQGGSAVQVKEVFEYWKEVLGKSDRTILDDKRRAKITARLREGTTVEELKTAILGVLKSPWHMGTDEKSNGKTFVGIETIFRDRAQVEKFIELEKGIAPIPPQTKSEKIRKGLEDWKSERRRIQQNDSSAPGGVRERVGRGTNRGLLPISAGCAPGKASDSSGQGNS